ncbi:hypothetical protein EJ05DRAFT_508178 [Pseudovirgaria hyperparasitica]|uniref:Stress response protein NST1 n=1 Tax=Pseudovirgaria hyperparasitica TaxID=470096 RepID=A0A6A6WDQ1_9PEZI|nr:uncharacterized protein EJ05DRAFT_508178 [Pseudovirgaria hyperparasitica]KAF2760948.1 hypothetical protein EJ05DRAFT_508178 [Pseudovirgaria hyperparasitica]
MVSALRPVLNMRKPGHQADPQYRSSTHALRSDTIRKDNPHNMAQVLKSQSNTSNGVAAGPGPATVGGNKKKAKRRAKLAAKQQATEQAHAESMPSDYPDPDLAEPEHYAEIDSQYYSDDDEALNGHASNATGSKVKRKTRSNSLHNHHHHHNHAPPPPPPPFPQTALRSVSHSIHTRDKIWNTSTQEERENIKAFWLSLGEDERKSLVKIEKEAVLKKMKEQQKHSCSCTVCGRKRTAIEEELEVLYDAYYEELEQYAHLPHGSTDGAPMLPPTRRFANPLARHPPDRMPHLQHAHTHSHDRTELADDGNEDEEGGKSDEYSDDDDYEGDDISEEDIEEIPRGQADFFNFGNSLTVKGGILTVADDLLKNDGKKFIEMMEQLAERRMQREEQAQFRSDPHLTHSHNHGDLPDDDDYEDDEEEYDESEGDEYEEEEMVSSITNCSERLLTLTQDAMTEEQRMEEGRRMFQIFAARMFEQRVLTAYREKVARERQQKLLEELEDEERQGVQREAKKARDAQKKKDKKAQQKQAKAEERARKEAEKAQEEAEARALEEKKAEEQRRRKEEQRKKKEAEKKAQEEERARKEQEKQRRVVEQRERQQEAERKVQEQKALERRAREDAKRREREEREAKEKEAKEKKAHDEKSRRDRDSKLKTEKEAKDRARKEESSIQHAPAAQSGTTASKRNVQTVPVALPPGLLPRQPPAMASPQVPIATPALPKAPTPIKPRQPSQQGSHGSSPKTPHVSIVPSKSTSPSTIASTGIPKQLLTRPSQHHGSSTQSTQSSSPSQSLGPPGINHQHLNHGFGGAMPPGLNGFITPSPLLPNMGQRGPGPGMPPMFPMHHQNPIPSQFRGLGPPGPGMPPPPGMGGPGMMPPHGQGYGLNAPPGFPAPIPGIGMPMPGPGFREGLPSHSRQASGTMDSFNGVPHVDDIPHGGYPPNPIARPTPIQRPSSVKPREDRPNNSTEVDDLSNHLGSKALLDDTDDPNETLAPNDVDSRRSSIPQGVSRMPFGSAPNGSMFPVPNRPRVESFGLGGPSGASNMWSTPTGFGPMSAPGLPSAGGWGSSPTGRGLPFGFGASRPSLPYAVSLRLRAIQAYRDLNASKSQYEHCELNEILQRINSNPNEAPTTPNDLKAVLETEGDNTNGGGLFHFHPSGSRLFVTFEEGLDLARKSGVGEIGSPIQGHSIPHNPFNVPIGNRPFPNLGPS